MRSQWIWMVLMAAACGLGWGADTAHTGADGDEGAQPARQSHHVMATGSTVEDSNIEARLDVGGLEQAGGAIKGIVKFAGKQRKPKAYRVDADKFCAHAHKDTPLLKETYVFGKNGTLQNVFVYVSDGLKGVFDPPTQPAVVNQRGCSYVPHVSGVIVKQPLEIRNGDDTLHNVKLTSKKNGRENKTSRKGQVLTKTFKKSEMGVTYQCDVHSWMKAYVHVLNHPFFAVTQQDGTFEIRGLPPGEYTVSVWHEFARFAPDKQSVTVTVSENETAELAFTYAPKKK